MLYSDDLAWKCLLRNEPAIRDFFLQLALDVAIDRGEGCAWLRQRERGLSHAADLTEDDAWHANAANAAAVFTADFLRSKPVSTSA
jgi:hypothetical protein